MAEASALNQNAIVRIWRAFGLKPHLRENFKLSTDPLFVEKVRDIVGLDLNPPGGDRRGVFRSVDELTAAINDYIETRLHREQQRGSKASRVDSNRRTHPCPGQLTL